MDNKNEKLLYISNKKSLNLVILAILINASSLIVQLNNMNITYLIGFTIILNIALTLLGFLCAVRINIYSVKWTNIGIILGIIQIIKLFTVSSEITGSDRFIVCLLLAISAGFYLLACFISLKKIKDKSTVDSTNVEAVSR